MKRCMLMLLLILAAPVLCGCGASEENADTYLQITADEAAEIMAMYTPHWRVLMSPRPV